MTNEKKRKDFILAAMEQLKNIQVQIESFSRDHFNEFSNGSDELYNLKETYWYTYKHIQETINWLEEIKDF